VFQSKHSSNFLGQREYLFSHLDVESDLNETYSVESEENVQTTVI
jgi:hypothetical protein